MSDIPRKKLFYALDKCNPVLTAAFSILYFSKPKLENKATINFRDGKLL